MVRLLFLPLLISLATPVLAQTPPVAPEKTAVEIYRIAPGQHAAFLRFIDRCDEANRMAGVPPRQLFVHADGASWDFMLLQPEELPPEKQAAVDAAWKKLGLPSGAAFFLEIRKFIVEHTDTFAIGPTTARDYLAGVSPP